MAKDKGILTRHLQAAPGWLFSAYAIAAAFSTYFCMYAFRKPFSGISYAYNPTDGSEPETEMTVPLLDVTLDLKTVFVISQIIGYAISKFVGIKVCSEVTRGRRLLMLVGFIVIAQVTLVAFAVGPIWLKVAAIFCNGLPLGMVWGLVVWYLEGRRTSELLLAGLSCSFILASGVVKDVGRWLINAHGVPDFWMPAATGAVFMLPFLLAVFMLNQLPGPTAEDEAARTHREPMDGKHRLAFLKHFIVPLSMLFVAYFFLTAFRDIRDNYGAELFAEMGVGEDDEAIFTRSESWVAFGVLVPLAMLSLIKNNRAGLLGAFGIMAFGAALLGVGTWLYDQGHIKGLTWMILIGLGSYLTYVPFGSVLFDRMIATTRVVGTAVFAIYVADALGYTGSVALQLYNDLYYSSGDGPTQWEPFFVGFSYFMSITGLVLIGGAAGYFVLKHRRRDEQLP